MADLHFKLRISDEMHNRLKIEAVKNRRTLSAEILKRVDDSFNQPTKEEIQKVIQSLLFAIGG